MGSYVGYYDDQKSKCDWELDKSNCPTGDMLYWCFRSLLYVHKVNIR